MSDLAREITAITIETELKQSYLDYAMSVIVGRALPDVRDGLKPVHRRVLYAMHELSNDYNKPYKKSARVVGDVIGKYHPHGDTAVYDTIVRMAQPFSLRYMLVDGQGNFGSVDGDAPAAMRYTEVRMSRLAHALLADLEKNTVDFAPNYDGTEQAPVVLPTRIPNLLVNGSSGIAVGMATNIPPHNLGEVVSACLALLENPELTVDELISYIPGPDFPTAGIISGRSGIVEAYRTGRGRIRVRAKTHIEVDEKSNKQTIVVDELPFQVNKARLIEKIAELVKDKKLEGITGLRDESDKDGMRIAIEARRGDNVDVLLNNLFAHTQLQVVFGINMVALMNGQPKVLNLRDVLTAFLRHRREVVTRRTLFDLAKAKDRAHLLEGLGVALANIEAMIELIKTSANPAVAKERLLATTWDAGWVGQLLSAVDMTLTRPESLAVEYGLHDAIYRLSPEQAQAILDLRLHRLTGLEQDKIHDEYQTILVTIQDLLAILSDPERLRQVITDELNQVKTQFADVRRTEIIDAEHDFDMEDLIPEQDVVVTLSNQGYAKYQALDQYQAQRRGGRGKAATTVKEEEFVETLLIASTHDTLLCFSNKGKVYWLKVYQLPLASRGARGRPLVNLLPLAEGEQISAMLPVRQYADDHYIFMATAMGTVKKVKLSQFSRPRSNGIIAVELDESDKLIGVALTDGEQEILLFSDAGKVIRFPEADVRSVGRLARGVRGIRLADEQRVISLVVAPKEGDILTATSRGYGKRTDISEYRLTGRGGQGVISIQVNERNGAVVGACAVQTNDEVMLITDAGTLVRTRVVEISCVGRNTQGVTLIRLAADESLAGLQPIAELLLDTADIAQSDDGSDELLDHT